MGSTANRFERSTFAAPLQMPSVDAVRPLPDTVVLKRMTTALFKRYQQVYEWHYSTWPTAAAFEAQNGVGYDDSNMKMIYHCVCVSLSLFLSLCVCVSLSPTLYLFVCVSFCLSLFLSLALSLSHSFCLSINLDLPRSKPKISAVQAYANACNSDDCLLAGGT